MHDGKSGRAMEYGRGVWSVVYMASSHPSDRTTSMLTPPSSPGTKTCLLAIKMPARNDAGPVLWSEAQTLTRLCRIPGNELYVVPFHGYISSSNSIVMSGIPLSLSTYIENEAQRKRSSSSIVFDPVPGRAQWLDMVIKFASALSWLHNVAHTVHGDIKPHSFLLRPRDHDQFPYDPVLADFSSSHDLASLNTASSMSALTPPFTAPEFLSTQVLKSPDTVPTTASDVFSLAATLLATATGDLLVYPGASSMQRLLMARDGHRLVEFARSGANGIRVPRNGIVEQTLLPAIAKDPAQRATADAWLDHVRTLSG